MHKPINILKNDDEITSSQKINLQMSLNASLFLSPSPKISYSSFFKTLSNLSYDGDLRMLLKAEDPQKVNKIVTSSGQLQKFKELYSPYFRVLEEKGVLSFGEESIEWDVTSSETLIKTLPVKYQNNLKEELINTVRYASTVQSLKGVVTAGVGKGVEYLGEKIKKGMK